MSAESESKSLEKYWVLVRAAGAIAIGVVAALFIGQPTRWEHALIGWIFGAGFYVVATGLVILPMNPTTTRRHAEELDWRHHTIGVLLVAAAFFSLVAVGAILKASGTGGPESLRPALIGLLGVVVSWTAVQSVFILRYADLYYSHSPDGGGIDFEPKGEKPNYIDFAYLAFTIGIAYAVSDTTLGSHKFRKWVLLHTLVSYVFGAVILAATVNLVVGLDFLKPH